ncbi:hypothetical protein MPH_02499 [Macrophomina phaseolina MS6]|uniref:Uncharacterized protein n=1 Tax=Macrophomina phaseolina (strain MS6) TaxID=1126212 RepID=K2S575_MACPH|nr:hypothetical protein MPH_02499 [Macrophomina phaseolina MS6]
MSFLLGNPVNLLKQCSCHKNTLAAQETLEDRTAEGRVPMRALMRDTCRPHSAQRLPADILRKACASTARRRRPLGKVRERARTKSGAKQPNQDRTGNIGMTASRMQFEVSLRVIF